MSNNCKNCPENQGTLRNDNSRVWCSFWPATPKKGEPLGPPGRWVNVEDLESCDFGLASKEGQ